MNLKRLKNYLVITLLALVGISASAQTSASAIEAKKQTLFSSANHSSKPYRIPAIATLINGDILAISDQRPCGADIGHGEVDIYAKVSKDNGATWTPSSQDPSSLNDKPGRIADGTGNTSEWDTGFGDAAVVVDRESGNVLVVCVAGNVVYGSSSGHNKMAQIRATFNKTTGELNWQAPEDKTSEFFKGDLSGASTMFMASGKMVQSTKIKVGTHYRIYGALLVNNKGNYVVYSDNFGESWSTLGGACCSSGNEAKVEELPNGDIVLSSRTSGGRYFNVYTYSDKTSWNSGKWDSATKCSFAGDNSTNGEILLYPGIDSNNNRTLIMLQSLPIGSKEFQWSSFSYDTPRKQVSVYYKVITEKNSYQVSDFTSGWTKGIEVDNSYSAYSTMTIMSNGEVGFLYEDNYDTDKADGDYSDIVFVPLTLSELTNKKYANLSYDSEYYTIKGSVPLVVTPTITPNGGTIFKEQDITLSCNTKDASIYYTIDGSEPTVSSTKYEGAFTLSASATVKAIAVKEGYNDSQVASATYTVVSNDATKYRFKNVQKDGTVYYFTYDATNGIGLTANESEAALYTRTVKNEANGVYNFQTADENYLIWSGRGLEYPGYNDGKGFLTSYESAKCDLTLTATNVFNGTYYTIKGKRQGKNNVEEVYFVIQRIGAFEGAKDTYFTDDLSSAFLIEEVAVKEEPEVKKVAAPVFNPAGGEVEYGTEISITCATPGAKIYITVDGTEPTAESIEFNIGSSPIGLDLTIKAIAILEGWENSDIATAVFTIKKETVATPVIAPNGGKIYSGDEISITCATEDVMIYYTIDGSEPTTESIRYWGEFTLEEDATVKAIAVKDGWKNSAIATAQFTIDNRRSITANILDGYMNGATRYMATFSAPFDVTVPSDVKVYIVKKVTSSYTYFSRLYNNNIPAYTGVLLQATKAGELVIPEAKEGVKMANVNGNILIDTADGPKVLDTQAYVFGRNKNTKNFAFYSYNAGVTVPQYRAYYVLGSSFAKVAAIGLSFDDETGESSGIEDVNAEDAEVEYYNLQGVKVENPEKGIYIMKQGGKTSKVVL